MLDQRISAVSSRGSRSDVSGDELGGLGEERGPLNLMKLSTILSEGNVVLTSMKEFREELVARLREVYQNFADKEFESLDELHEDSVLGGAAEQCAFAITAILDSFANQFEEHVDRNNSTVEYLLEFSDELGLPDQAKGDQEPLVGMGVVRLSERVGKPCNGIRVGNDEIGIIDEVTVHTEFVNYIAGAASNLISEASSSERHSVADHETFSVSEDCEYAYGETIFPGKVTGVRTRH